MTEIDRWQQNNDIYLARALHWLRLRLGDRLQPTPSPPETPPAPPPQRWFNRLVEPPAPPLPESAVEIVPDDSLDVAAAAMEEAAQTSPPPALIQLTEQFGLSAFEQNVLLLCVAMEIDTRIASLCARVQGLAEPGYPTFALALSLFESPAWDVRSPERPLRYWRMVEITQPGGQPLTTSPLRADERIVNYVKGLNYLDDRLTPLLLPLDPFAAATQLPASLTQHVGKLVSQLQSPHPLQQTAYVQLVGDDTVSKQLIAQRTAAELGLALYRLPLDLLPTQLGDLETFSRLWQRESGLFPFTLLLDTHGHNLGSDTSPTVLALRRFLSRNQLMMFLSTDEVQQDIVAASLVVEVAKPTPREQQVLWQQALGNAAPASPPHLASQFRLTPVAIQQIAQEVLRTGADLTPAQLHRRLWDSCLVASRPQLDRLAQPIDPKATWHDLVLPPDDIALLRQIADQVRLRNTVYETWGFSRKMNRGMGISALFAGESGTGKTMAAEVIANELRLNLYRIDLSSVVSKYIGETEKNLRQLFDAAEDGGAILFFDEADALFGKRSEVKDSHDRYANIEINYLLQRMEVYSGLAILATNMKSSLDPAFVRRLRFIVPFPFPGVNERQQMWQKVFPSLKLTRDLDFQRLAQLNLTGGSIHNVALNAAFLAARQRQPITMPLVLQAARAEFRKLNKPVDEAEFRWQPAQLPPVAAPESLTPPTPPTPTQPPQIPQRRRR